MGRPTMSILDSQVDNLTSNLGRCKIKSWGAVELNVLGWIVLANIKHVALDVEDFHGETTRLWDPVL